MPFGWTVPDLCCPSVVPFLLRKVFSTQVEVITTSNHSVEVTLLDIGANTCFMDRCYRFCNIVEESKLVCAILDKLACVISFNIISNRKYPIVLG